MKVIFAIPGLFVGYSAAASLRDQDSEHKEWAYALLDNLFRFYGKGRHGSIKL
jgi:hypothetical protein